MIEHSTISQLELRKLIKQNKIQLGGNKKLKVYGRLQCVSGKKMMKVNRVFFESELEAIRAGYRPCGKCLVEQYKKWKAHGVV